MERAIVFMQRQPSKTNQKPQELMKVHAEIRNGKSHSFHAETIEQSESKTPITRERTAREKNWKD